MVLVPKSLTSAVTSLPTLTAPRTYYIQRWDESVVTINARSYYKTETSYIFTNITHNELKLQWNRGTLMEVPPVLEIDIDAVIMILDGDAGCPVPQKAKTARRSRKKT